MKNVFLYSWLFCAVTICSYGQHILQNNNWVFGTRNSLRFIDDPATNPIPSFGYTTGTIPSTLTINSGGSEPSSFAVEGCASVSDRLGNLLFYTDGIRVLDGNNVLITGGLRGNRSSAQNVIIIPRPNHNKVFYIITIIGETLTSPGAIYQQSRGLYFSEIDLERPLAQMMVSMNTPLSDMNGVPITGDPLITPRNAQNNSEAITSALHSNGTDYWLIANVNAFMSSSGNYEDNIFSYQITENGISLNATNASPVPFDNSEFAFSMKISPDTHNLAIATSLDGLFIGNFDSSNGSVVFNSQITRPNGIFKNYSSEFSPNSNYLYYSGNFRPSDLSLPDENFLVRYDLGNNSSVTNIIDNYLAGLQRGIDDNIYITGGSSNTSNLLVINDPDNINNSGQIVLNPLIIQRHWSHGLPQWVWKQTCENTLVDDEDIPATYLVQEQRSNWIQCVNFVDAGARGIYHAGDFIEMLPENGTNLGFEAELGSEFVAYIAPCDSGFNYRNANTETNSNQEANKASVTVDKLQIYPNPSNTYVTITLDSDKIRSIVITSIDGKVIQSLNINSHAEQIDVSGFTNGLYLITVQTEDGRNIVNKFIKN